MKREIFQKKIILYCFFITFLWSFFTSCEGTYTIQGKVIAINGEPLPGVCISSPGIFKHVITNAKGNFVFRFPKPINKLEFIKSDYLPYTVSLQFSNEESITLSEIVLTPKPFVPGVYFLLKEKNRYTPLVKGKIERTQVEKQNSVPSIKLSEIVATKDQNPLLYVFRLPQYDLTLYRMKEYIFEKNDDKLDKKIDESNKKSKEKDVEQLDKKIWIPDEPILTHTEFLSEIDTSLFIVRPVNELKAGVYCINWRAFEVPFPRMHDCFLFSVVEEPRIDGPSNNSSNESNPSQNLNNNIEKTKDIKRDKE